MNSTTLIRQLRDLLRLTQAEEQVARLRVAQARTETVRRDLRRNADNAGRRSRRISDQLRALGGVPDALTPLVGRFTGMLKGVAEQGQPFDEALLQDLDLEQRLLGRARYLAAAAEAADDASLKQLAQELIEAHSETVEWISTVLAEDALGGPAALRATAAQRAAGGVTRMLSLPVRYARDGLNRAIDQAQHAGDQMRSTVEGTAQRAGQLARDAREVAATGVHASLSRAEEVSRQEGASTTAAKIHEARQELGALEEHELPIEDYDSLNQQQAIDAVKDLGRATDVRTMLNYEQAHKDRVTVISAIQARMSTIAKTTTGMK